LLTKCEFEDDILSNIFIKSKINRQILSIINFKVLSCRVASAAALYEDEHPTHDGDEEKESGKNDESNCAVAASRS
jgi:hypothetical protein